MRCSVLAVLVLLLVSSACFALSDQRKQCVKVCCENAGGVYGWEYNSCENSSNSDESYACALNCTDPPEAPWCPIAILPLAITGIAFVFSRR